MRATTQTRSCPPLAGRATINLIRSAALLGAILLGSVLQAQSSPHPIPWEPWPGDRVGVPALGGGCPVVQLDPNRAPSIRQTSFTADPYGNPEADTREYELRYWSHVLPDSICGVPPPMDYRQLIDVGPLPVGWHYFTAIGHLNGVEVDRYRSQAVLVRVRERPRVDISGVWYAPEQSGRGLFVARLGRQQGSLMGFWWSNHDAEGRPTWVVMTADNYLGNDFEGEAITTHGPPMAPGPATIERERWGELSFSYQGCGRARMEWSADDEAIGDGSIDLVQLLLPEGITPCDISSRMRGPPAIWEAPTAE